MHGNSICWSVISTDVYLLDILKLSDICDLVCCVVIINCRLTNDFRTATFEWREVWSKTFFFSRDINKMQSLLFMSLFWVISLYLKLWMSLMGSELIDPFMVPYRSKCLSWYGRICPWIMWARLIIQRCGAKWRHRMRSRFHCKHSPNFNMAEHPCKIKIGEKYFWIHQNLWFIVAFKDIQKSFQRLQHDCYSYLG